MAQRAARYLPAYETIQLEVRRHWSVLAGPFAAAVGALLVAAALGYFVSPRTGSDLFDWFVGIVAAFFALRFVYKVWEWHTNRVVVTDHRFVEVSGIVTRKVASMPITKVTDMTYRRTLPGRLLGYGDLILETAGQDQAFSRIDHLPHPDSFYRRVTSLLAQESPPAAPPPSGEGGGGGAVEPERDDTGKLPRVSW
jgi:uncharacterized membrane protein YdbT with pleckstrin-like domain